MLLRPLSCARLRCGVACASLVTTCGCARSSALPPVRPLVQAMRAAHTYPTLPRAPRPQASTKKYNYLTADRLVHVRHKRLSAMRIREQDDKLLARRRFFRQQLIVDVQERIKYFEPFITKFVFFPCMREHGVTSMFRGSMTLAPRTYTRVYMHVVEQLLTRQRRPQLLELFALANIDPPSEAEWTAYCDPQTGDVNIGLVYPRWFRDKMEWYIARLHYERQCRADGITLRPYKPVTLFDAYVFLHYRDPTRVPSLREWSSRQGPLQESELIIHSRTHMRVGMALRCAQRDLRVFGRAEMEAAVAQLTVEERHELLRTVTARREELLEAIQRQQLFAAKITLALSNLPEVRAIRTERMNFREDYECRWIIANNGRFWPRPPSAQAQWRLLSPEEQLQYTCFGRRHEIRPSSGLQLYVRYMSRDYGISRSEAGQRYWLLTDVQQAALQFPFYMPIAPKLSDRRAYRRFCYDMCRRYGCMSTMGHAGNALFDIAMRQRWNAMSPEEQRRYEDKDDFAHIFPLQPSSSSSSATTELATAAETTTTTTATKTVTTTTMGERAAEGSAAIHDGVDARNEHAVVVQASNDIGDGNNNYNDNNDDSGSDDDDEAMRRAERSSRASRQRRRRVQLLHQLLLQRTHSARTRRLLQRSARLRRALARLRAQTRSTTPASAAPPPPLPSPQEQSRSMHVASSSAQAHAATCSDVANDTASSNVAPSRRRLVCYI